MNFMVVFLLWMVAILRRALARLRRVQRFRERDVIAVDIRNRQVSPFSLMIAARYRSRICAVSGSRLQYCWVKDAEPARSGS